MSGHIRLGIGLFSQSKYELADRKARTRHIYHEHEHYHLHHTPRRYVKVNDTPEEYDDQPYFEHGRLEDPYHGRGSYLDYPRSSRDDPWKNVRARSYDVEYESALAYNQRPHREPRDFHREWKARFEAADSRYYSSRRDRPYGGHHGYREPRDHYRHQGYDQRHNKPYKGYHSYRESHSHHQPHTHNEHHDKLKGGYYGHRETDGHYQPRYQPRGYAPHDRPRNRKSRHTKSRTGDNLEARHTEHPDHYEVLGLSPYATQAEIDRASKARRIETHPDKCKKPGMSEEELAAIDKMAGIVAQAAEILKDPNLRAEYDYEHRTRNISHRR